MNEPFSVMYEKGESERVFAELAAWWSAQGRRFFFALPSFAKQFTFAVGLASVPPVASVWVGDVPKARRDKCGAKTRKGTSCACLLVPGKARCKFHGGLSTGAKTPEGKARIVESNRRRAVQ